MGKQDTDEETIYRLIPSNGTDESLIIEVCESCHWSMEEGENSAPGCPVLDGVYLDSETSPFYINPAVWKVGCLSHAPKRTKAEQLAYERYLALPDVEARRLGQPSLFEASGNA